MTLEYLNEQKKRYQEKTKYFKNIGFEILSEDFQRVVGLIEEMEKFIEEKQSEDNAE